MGRGIHYSHFSIHQTMKSIIVLLCGGLLLSSCTSYQATIRNQQELQYEQVRVYPAWEHKEPKGKKVILPIVGLTAGAIYGSQTEYTYGSETYSGLENAAIWGGAGLLGGLFLNQYVFKNNAYRAPRFDASQSDEWIKSYNAKQGHDYLIVKEDKNNSLIIVPRENVIRIRDSYNALERDLARSQPTTTFLILREWEANLKGQYSILPQNEIQHVQGLIAENRTRVANNDLESAQANIDKMKNEYSSISGLSRMKGNLGAVYTLANANTRTTFDNRIRDKTVTILNEIIPDELARLERIPLDYSGIQEVNTFYRSTNNKFGSLRNYSVVSSLYEKLDEKKASVIAANAPRISSEIKNASTTPQLDTIEETYFANMLSESSVGNTLRGQLEQKREDIQEEQRRKRIAEQAAAQRRAQQLLEARNASLAAENRNLSPTSFSTRGLQNGKVFSNLYLGEFHNIPFDRDDVKFASLYGAYMYTFARECKQYVPVSNRDEILEDECIEETVTKNGWGVEISRYCSQYQKRRTGLYAKSEIYEVYEQVERSQKGNLLQTTFRLLLSDNGPAGALNTLGDARSMQVDMQTAFQNNACNSPGLQRFEDNLRMFALNERPKRLTGQLEVSSIITPQPGTLFKDQNYTELLEDLIFEQSKTWAINKFIKGSVSRVTVSSRDDLGRPLKISARYVYNGFSNSSYGRVNLTFDEGWPKCLYFSDNPTTCRAASRKIVANYAKGEY